MSLIEAYAQATGACVVIWWFTTALTAGVGRVRPEEGE